MRWGGWQEQHLDDVFVIEQDMILTLENSCDRGKMLMIETNNVKCHLDNAKYVT